MKQLFFFQSMLTPKIIVFVYWLQVLGSIVYGFDHIFGGFGGFSFSRLFSGLMITTGAVVASRIINEILIVMFKINEALQDIRSKQS
ncbi:DUF4282 domain-containing protein [Algiphilus sp. W345]|uniref:DUF4282 domain-containing protein n=1 Tax=Banduia mediterranea TaxID=3075609 RepID=A0ABU2WDU3_9GAMM|nr:DUF4282 domain-containing protein [Algiphilus sp. W345]MDT0496037.1 DUF4282 domain-containing protein [Algiphilus sp. W345]